MQPAGVDCSERRAKAGEGKHVGGEGWSTWEAAGLCCRVPGAVTPASRYRPRMQAGMENVSINQWRFPLQVAILQLKQDQSTVRPSQDWRFLFQTLAMSESACMSLC